MQPQTYLVLAQYRQRSEYADRVGSRYHFPKKYFNFMTLPSVQFIYYEPAKSGLGEYFGYGEVGEITDDSNNPDHYFAEINNYISFSKGVPGKDRNGLVREAGEFYNAQNAVRRIDPDVFHSICEDGGIELGALGVETENSDSDERISAPFDPSKIKVDREPMSVFQVLRKISLDEIVLAPEFQRNMVWDPIRRSRLIESALLRIPLPAFYLDAIDANHWVVVDGLQRLSTLRDFASNSFQLQGLEYLTKFQGLRFSELPRGMQRDLEETAVTLFIIRPETPAHVKFTIFYRLNTGGLVLTAQEIRHALFQGKSTRLLKMLVESNEFKAATDDGVSDLRMDARECVLRYLAFRIYGYQEYQKADLNSFLSRAMTDINGYSVGEIESLEKAFLEAMRRCGKILGRNAFRKFNVLTGRRGPVNKALFETWSNVLQAYDMDLLESKKVEISRSIGSVLTEDSDYLRSLSAGTGGIHAVNHRFRRAYEIVDGAIR